MYCHLDDMFDVRTMLDRNGSFSLDTAGSSDFVSLLQSQNQSVLTRVKPSNQNTPTNFDPLVHWQSGCQIVSMNHDRFGKLE